MPSGHALRFRFLVPQAQDEHQPQGDDQLQVVSLPQQEQDDEQEQQVPAVQVLQLQGLQQAAQSPGAPLSREEGGEGEACGSARTGAAGVLGALDRKSVV